MAYVFIGSHCSMSEVDAELDDPSIRDGSMLDALDRMASPQLTHVFMEYSVANCEALKASALEDFLDDYDYLTDCEDADKPPETEWRFQVHSKPKVGRESWSWLLVDKSDGAPVAMAVLQKVLVS